MVYTLLVNKCKYIKDIVFKCIAQAGKILQQDKGKSRFLTDLTKTLNIVKVKLVKHNCIPPENNQN